MEETKEQALKRIDKEFRIKVALTLIAFFIVTWISWLAFKEDVERDRARAKQTQRHIEVNNE